MPTINAPEKHKLYLIVGPSGTGKSTIARMLNRRGIREVISHTSRAPRTGEMNGVNYQFIPRDQFERMRERGEFIEHVEYNGNLYGSTYRSVEVELEDNDACIVVEGHGAVQFKKLLPGRCVSVFLMPPSDADLRARLTARGDSAELIEKRMNSKSAEMRFSWKMDRRVDADQPVEKVFNDVLRVIYANRGELYDINDRCIEVGQEVVYSMNSSRSAVLTAGKVIAIEQRKKQPWHKTEPGYAVLVQPTHISGGYLGRREPRERRPVHIVDPQRLAITKKKPFIGECSA